MVILLIIGLILEIIIDPIAELFELFNMKLFNALQVVMLYGAMPFILVWLSSDPAPFQYANAAWYVAVAMYLGLFCWITYMVFDFFSKEEK